MAVVHPTIVWLSILWSGAAAHASAQERLSVNESARAQHLLAERLPCLGCHSLEGRGGALAPDLAGVGARRSGAEIERILLDPARSLPGTVMPRIPMSADTRRRIVSFLSSEQGRPSGRALLPRIKADSLAAGAALYAQRCAACHGARGRGDGPNARNLERPPAVHADRRSMSRRTDGGLFDGIHAGGRALGLSPQMPAYGLTLSPAQIWSLVDYIRQLCKCREPDWANGR